MPGGTTGRGTPDEPHSFLERNDRCTG